MYEQDFSPMDKSIFQKYEPSNLLFSDAFRANYAYNSPSAAIYANSPLGGLGSNFASHSQQYAQSTFAAVALNALSNVPQSTSGNAAQSTFGLHHHQNQLNENTPVRSEHTSLEETQNHLEEQNSAEEEHIAALQAQHNVQSSSTIPNYPNYNSSNNNINSAINSNNVITGSTNININGSNSMNFSAQQNFILKKHLNDQPHQQQSQQNQNSQLSIPSIPTGSAVATAATAVSSQQTQGATAGAASAQFMGNNQAFRFQQYQAFDENLLQAHSNYPGTPYYEGLNQNNDNQNSLSYQYNQHTNSPNYSFQQAPAAQIQPTPSHQAVTGSQQNYSFSTAQSSFKKSGLPTNFFYDSPRNYGASFLPYTPPIAQQNAQSGFSQFIQNQQFPAEINIKQQQIFPEQDECSSYPFLSTPVHQIEQQQNQQQSQQQQALIPQSQSQKSGLNILQKQQQYQQMQRYHQEKAQLQQQQMQYTEQALLEQQQHQQQQIQNQTQYPNFGHHHQYIQQQQPSQFSNLLLPGNKLLPIQPSPLTIKQNTQDVSKIAIQAALKGKEQVDEQNYQETQESIQNEDEENGYQNGDESVEEDNQDGDDAEEEDDEEYGGSKKKGNNGSNKIKKGISKNQRRNKHTSISAISSSSLQNQTNNGSSTKMSRKQINETKNIPKNYSKAIIGYIQKHPDDCARLLGPEFSYDDFDKFLMDKKEKLTAIKDLRSLWTTNCGDQTQQAFNRVFRILSFKFFRENAVSYIYSSRKIKNTRALITYRFILQRALHDPESFSFMKFQN
ncbi:hypothetical protein ABPG74_009675 [Tetrahymena malaccensis]